jgi:N-acetylglucosamine malate deacetylase 2
MNRIRNVVLAVLFALVSAAAAQTAPPRVLIVVAHPDDESCFAVTVYKITHELGGTVDQVVITDGEGGYRYSLLAEDYYGVKLTDEAVGRAKLPDIRKQELLNSGRIMGVRKHFFLDQVDRRYTQDAHEVLERTWNVPLVKQELAQWLAAEPYDFVFTLFPNAETHGGHKAATILALETVQAMKGPKPVVLGCQDRSRSEDKALDWNSLLDYPITAAPAQKVFELDRDVMFGFNNALSYQIIANWVIAEHKSQGAFQMAMNKGDFEDFQIFRLSLPDGAARAEKLFDELAKSRPASK